MKFSTRFSPLSRVFFTLLACSGTALAVEPLNFIDGGSIELPNPNAVDAFPGMDGGGWTSPWHVSHRPTRSHFNAATATTHPLTDSATSYLQMEFEDRPSEVGSMAGVRRKFSTEPEQGGIDPTQPHEISVRFRLDELSEDFATPRDEILLRGGNWGDGLENTEDFLAWEVLYRYGLGWLARSGDGETTTRFGPRDLALHPETVWHIRVMVFPTAGVFRVTLENSEGLILESSDTLFAKLSAPTDTLGFYLTRVGEGKRVVCSFGDIQVRQVD